MGTHPENTHGIQTQTNPTHTRIWVRVLTLGNRILGSFRILFSASDLTFTKVLYALYINVHTSFSHSTLATQNVKKLPNKTCVIIKCGDVYTKIFQRYLK